ncbi:MAG: PAS domain S-box protein [Holophagaceae bacterium]|nr:PAS domain S-box protein [Holophagaceae bacterium]
MADKEVRPASSAAMRRKSEETALADAARRLEPVEPLTAEAARAVLHELRVHQIELEMQNEELRRIQEALETEKGKYFELYDLAPVGYCTVSDLGLILLANLTAARMLGLTRDRKGGLPFVRFIHPEDQDPFHRFQRRLVETGSPETCELRMVRADGAHFAAHLEAAMALDPEAGRTFRIVLTDITARVRAARERQELETRYQSILNASPDNITILDLEGLVQMVSPAALGMFGYERVEDMEGRPVLDFIAPADHLRANLILAGLAEGVIPRPGEYQGLRRDGSTFDTEVNSELIRDPAGRPASIVLVVRDITHRKEAEAALWVSEARNRAIAQSAYDAIITSDSAGAIAGWNRGAEAIFGYAEAEVLGQPMTLLMPERHRAAHLEGMLRVGSGGDQHVIGRTVELHGIRKGGEEFAMELSMARWESEGDWFITGIIRDITQRKASEAALRESEARLRLALTAAEQGLYDLNVQTGEAAVSPEYATMLGFDPATFRETNAAWIERLHPEDREPVAAAYRDYVAGLTKEYRIEFRQRTASGDWKWILSLGRVVERGPDGAPLRMLGTHTDITERKRIEVDLRRQTGELRARNEELQRFNRLVVGRELRMIELKEEINALCRRLGEAPRHRGSNEPVDPRPAGLSPA